MNNLKTTSSLSEPVVNSLNSFTSAFTNPFGTGAFVGRTDSLYYNLRYNLVSNDRNLLSQMYVEHGIVQTLVDQPVDDAFSTGFEIVTDQLEPAELDKLEMYIERNNVIGALRDALKWARLYGGGGILIITGQNPQTEFKIESIKEGGKLAFRGLDMWEMVGSGAVGNPSMNAVADPYDQQGDFYNYYGTIVNKTRVYKIKGKEAPAFIRQRLRGWGMSELERLVRSINQYMKNQNVLFELIDEAKVDVFKIKGFNTAMLSANGTAQVVQRVQQANQVKNYINAITMDADDDYDQKKMSFTGLGEVMSEIRMQVASDLKMPMSKLFGIPSTGFSSGEDDLQNYNSMVEGEIRAKSKFQVIDLLAICCQHLFGFVPDDLSISWNPLKQLNAVEEEEVKNSKFNRNMSSYQSGAIDRTEWAENVNHDHLLATEVDTKREALEPLTGQFTVGTPTQ
ncbi:MAG: hypothetical protein COB09_18905 [Thalassobium sp.]|nr:MAG: hypothetical protein COB09_18905 [Thalassobium sp.]